LFVNHGGLVSCVKADMNLMIAKMETPLAARWFLSHRARSIRLSAGPRAPSGLGPGNRR
jgi:hypothetical protein